MCPSSGDASRTSGEPLGVVAGHAGTRQVILAAAQELFGQRGYDATSLREIADAVGMTKAAIYYHYPAKEHLLVELTKPMVDAISDMVTRLRSDDGATDAVAALEAYLDLFLAHLPVVRIMAQDPATQNHPDIGKRLRILVDSIQREIAGADASAEATIRTACAMGVIHSVATMEPDIAVAHRAVILDAAAAAMG